MARLWPEVVCSAVDPGWVPTSMGGRHAPDDLQLGHVTQAWLAVSDDPDAGETGGYWFHQERREPHPAPGDVQFQRELLAELERVTGVAVASGSPAT